MCIFHHNLKIPSVYSIRPPVSSFSEVELKRVFENLWESIVDPFFIEHRRLVFPRWTTRVFTRAAVIIFFPDSVLFTFGYFTCRSVSQLCCSTVDTNCDASLYIGAAWYNDNDDDDHHQYTTTHCATHYTEIVLHSTIMISSEQIHVDNHHNALFFVHTGSPTALLAICERESQQLNTPPMPPP